MSSSDLRGSTTPRLWTPALRDVDEPGASYGPAVIQFAARVLKQPLTPAQEWLVTHAGELLEDGRPRFRRVLVIQARQSGKTTLLATLALFWLYVERLPLTLGLSTTVATAREAWERALVQAESIAALQRQITQIRRANDGQFFQTRHGARYAIAAANRKGGRGLSVDRLIVDELREHHDTVAYDAAYPAMAARPKGQAWFITNMGDTQSVVLNSMRETALSGVDERLGLFEWSAPADCDPQDPAMWAQANPNLGIYQDVSDLAGSAAAAAARGGAELAGFMTERLCVPVTLLDPAVDPNRWRDATDLGDMADVRDRVALALDVSLDGQHATVVAGAVLPDGRCRLEVVAAYEGQAAASQLAEALPKLVGKVKPRAVGWLPGGPAASLLGELAPRPGWPPAGVEVAELRSEIAAVCMAFAEAVTAGQVVHSADPLLDAHVQAAERKARGDTWVFSRRGGHVDAAYAAAAAVFLARSLPAPRRTVLPTPLS